MADFLGTEGAILYSDGASGSTSTVAAFAKRGDLLVVDEGCHEALLVGVTLSRANVRYFRHNNVRDLRRVLEKISSQDRARGRRSTDQRRFLVVEGLYRNWGTIAPLDEIVKLKEEFHYRLILDDSHGIGSLGTNGMGSLEHHGLRYMVHAEIVTFSLEYSLGSVGGMTVGSEEVVDHQRLSGAGYCFSASAPPFLSKVCLASVRRLEGGLDGMTGDIGDDTVDGGLVIEGDKKTDIATMIDYRESNIEEMRVADLRTELKKRGLSASGRKAELRARLDDNLSSRSIAGPKSSRPDDLSGPALLERLHRSVSNLYGTLTNSCHLHALKLRDRLVITSHPQSPILYLRLADGESIGRTRAEQTEILDRISRHCLEKGGVAIVSTGGHTKKYLQLVPEPCLRLVANVSQTMEDVETLARALGGAVESVLVRNDGNAME
jgi:7-keto-8-aminopelargonate synthetase-like enzyme